jgi:ADP-ribose pyrophosphatase
MGDRQTYRGAWIEVVTEDVALPGGRHARLDIVRHPGAAAVVPFLSPDEVLLIRQYRHAAGGTLYEVPAGKLDAGEAPADCARRELEEETGWRAGRIERLGSLLTTPGFTDERIHLFAAWDLTPASQRLESDEVIELAPMPLARALELVWSGEIDDAKTALALLHAARSRGRLEG